MATGRHRYKFVDGEPRDELKCSKCKFILCDPQQANCCSKRFCKSCLDEMKDKRCPSCREPINYFKDGGINREIIALKVYCTNSEEGCEWQGTINETGTSIDTHLNSCTYQLVPCTNGYGVKIRRSSMETHLTDDCTQRIVNCQYCNQKGRYQLITSSSHLDECPDLPIQCSNEGCNMTPHRRSLASHKETCPKAIIPCEYNTVGCTEVMRREEQEKHNEESIMAHLQLTKKQLQVTKEQLQVTRWCYFYICCVCVLVFVFAFVCVCVCMYKELKTTKEQMQVMYTQLETTTKEQTQETHKQLETTKEQIQVTNKQVETTKKQLKVAKKTIKFLKTTLEQINASMTTNEVLKLNQFTMKKGKNEEWYSPDFYTSPGRYRMSLLVYPNGNGKGEGTHVSCYIYLMAGEYDDILEWPFQGDVTIELLNQLEDKNHWKWTVTFDESTPDECKQRVREGNPLGLIPGISPSGWGSQKFKSHEELKHDPVTNCEYLKDDSLYFRVSVKATSKTKPWLVGASRIISNNFKI